MTNQQLHPENEQYQPEMTEEQSVIFLRLWFRNCDTGTLNIRCGKDKPNQNEFVDINELERIPEIIALHEGRGENVYFACALRNGNDGTKEGISFIPGVWFEHDNVTPEIAERIRNAPCPPSFIIQSSIPTKWHVYYRFKEPLGYNDRSLVENLIARLIDRFGGDTGRKDASGILRIVGTKNMKRNKAGELVYGNPPPVVTVIECNELEYNPSDFDWLPGTKTTRTTEERDEDLQEEFGGGKREGERNKSLAKLAGRYVAKKLSRQEVYGFLLVANATYLPPLNKEEVEGILDSIIKGHESRHQSKVKKIPEEFEAEIIEMFQNGWDDAGMGKIFGNLYSDEYCYIEELKDWHRFGGVNWINDPYETERRMVDAVDSIHDLHYKHEQTKQEQNFKKIAGWHHNFRSDFKIRACLSQAENYLHKKVVLFDTDPWSLVCGNGVVDLKKGTFRNATAEDMFLKNTKVLYSQDAQCPMWLKFLSEIFEENKEFIDYLQRAVGYSLTGDVREDKFFLLTGGGSNGKTTILETLKSLLGDYITDIPFEILEVSYKGRTGHEATPDIAKLKGIRLVKSSETKEKSRFNVGRLKAFTGRDTLTARFLNQNPFDFSPTHKLWLSVNHTPRVDDDSDAMWRRVHKIPFNVRFVEPEKAKEGDKVQDKELQTKLKTELSGILNWAIKGCLEWQKEGLKPPKEVLSATEAYRKESDVINRFLEDETTNEKNSFEPSISIYKTFCRWCEENGEKDMNQSELGKKLKDKGYEDDRQGKGRVRGFKGIHLTDPVKNDDTVKAFRKMMKGSNTLDEGSE